MRANKPETSAHLRRKISYELVKILEVRAINLDQQSGWCRLESEVSFPGDNLY